MAKTKIENTREHDIIVAVALANGEIASVSVPGAKEQDKDGGGTELVAGTAEIEQEVLDLAMEKPVVKHYFEEGWLRLVKTGGAKKAAAQASATEGGTKAPWNTDK